MEKPDFAVKKVSNGWIVEQRFFDDSSFGPLVETTVYTNYVEVVHTLIKHGQLGLRSLQEMGNTVRKMERQARETDEQE
jgi:hypothetical protein